MIEGPPRLKDGDLGPILRAADPDIGAARLADNAASVKALIAAGTTTALWKLLLPLVLLGVIAIPVAYVATRSPAPHAAQVSIAPPVELAHTVDAQLAFEPEPMPAAVPDPAPAPPPHHRAITPPPAAPVDAAAVPAAPTSDLPAQIALYESARDAARTNQLDLALSRIEELLQRFPATQLRAEAELTRADVLARAGRTDEAARALEALIADAAHGGRRGELLRTLGDLHRRAGDCTHALDAYQRALAEHLGERDRKDAERGRDRCTPH
jgi:TolA-binding protein